MKIATGPLSHIKVLDLTAHRAGPTAVRQLADWGADVIKIESPEGDSTRHIGPGRNAGMARLFSTHPATEERIALRAPRSEAGGGRGGVLVVGVDSLLTTLARCCRPAPRPGP